MYYLAIAADYDGTIAHDGVVDPATFDALKEFKAGGRRLILVTGRELPDLRGSFRNYRSSIVLSPKQALIYDPSTEEGVGNRIGTPSFVHREVEGTEDRATVGRSLNSSHVGAA